MHGRSAPRAIQLSRQRELDSRVHLASRPVPVVEYARYHVLLCLRPQGGYAALLHVSCVHVRSAVLRALQQLRDAVLVEVGSPRPLLVLESARDVRHRMPGKQHVLHAAHDARFALVDPVEPVYDVPAVHRVPVRHAPLGVLPDTVSDALAVKRALVFRQNFEHAELQNAAGTA